MAQDFHLTIWKDKRKPSLLRADKNWLVYIENTTWLLSFLRKLLQFKRDILVAILAQSIIYPVDLPGLGGPDSKQSILLKTKASECISICPGKPWHGHAASQFGMTASPTITDHGHRPSCWPVLKLQLDGCCFLSGNKMWMQTRISIQRVDLIQMSGGFFNFKATGVDFCCVG